MDPQPCNTIIYIASAFRNNFTVDQLRAIHNVGGRECGISGDMWLTSPQRKTTP